MDERDFGSFFGFYGGCLYLYSSCMEGKGGPYKRYMDPSP